MIHRLEQERVKVDEIAGHMQGRDLPPAIRQHFIAPSKSIQQQRAVTRTAADGHDIGAGRKLMRFHDCFCEQCLLAVGQDVVLPEVEEKWGQQGTAPL